MTKQVSGTGVLRKDAHHKESIIHFKEYLILNSVVLEYFNVFFFLKESVQLEISIKIF